MKDSSARVLPALLSTGGSTSVQSAERCRQQARTSNYAWYGVQNGEQLSLLGT
jgi:hypothetical protein